MLQVIPIAAQAGMTGFESPAAEYTQLGLSLDQLLIDHPSATYIGYCKGDSMEGDGIFSGDLLIISRSEPVEHNDIIVANLNGVFVCKRIDIKGKQLLSSGEGFKPYPVNDTDEFQQEGVVIRSIRLHKPLSTRL